MKSTILLSTVIFILNHDIIASQNIKCLIARSTSLTNPTKVKETYECKIQNDDFTRINVQHVQGKNDDNVKTISRDFNENKNYQSFPSKICEKFKNLAVVKIEHVRFANVNGNSLVNCKSLSYLSLYGNNLRTLPQNFFSAQSQLWRLELNSNELEELPVGIFDAAENLYWLELDHNKLKTLHQNLFNKLINLNQIHLQNNQLGALPEGIFDTLVNLERLFIGKNKIKILHQNLFKNLVKIQEIDLSENQIDNLSANIFTSLVNLKLLSIHGNKLTTLNTNSFGSSLEFTEILFNNNQINSIDETIFNHNINLREINGASNPCAEGTVKIRDNTQTKSKIHSALKRCFENYQRRSRV